MEINSDQKNLSIHFTDRCNNSCIFCVVGSHQDTKEAVNKKLIFQFLKENRDKNFDMVNIHGGEASLCEEFTEILDKIKEFNYPAVSLQTNGRRLADPEYAKTLTDKGVKLFVVSVHGANAKTHDRITRARNSFEEAIAGIRNVKTLGQKVRTNTVVCKYNLSELNDIMDTVLGLNVDHVNISAIHPANKAYENFHEVTPRYSEIKDSVINAIEKVKSRNVKITLEGFPPCIIPGYEEFRINWSKLKFKMLFHTFILNNYSEFMEKSTKIRGVPCQGCKYPQLECGGVYKEYIEFYGWNEFKAVENRA